MFKFQINEMADRRGALPLQLILIFLSVGGWAADRPEVKPPKDAVPVPMTMFNFDREVPGRAPAFLIYTALGKGPEIHWEVREDPEAPSRPYVLAQQGKAEPGDNFAVALLERFSLDRGEIAVRFKIVGGDETQAAGIVWRYQDPQNYYVVRASSKEDNFQVYRVKKGKRKLIDEKAVVVTPYTWHEMRLIFVDKKYTAFLDGEAVIGGKDGAYLGAGQIGLWTQSDSAIRFDDLRVSK